MMVVAIDGAGRVVIPKQVRERLDLGAGTELELEVQGDGMRLMRRRDTPRRLEWDDGRPVLRSNSAPLVTDADVQRLRDAQQR